MAMPQTLDRHWTAAEVQAMQDRDPSHRYQVVDGELLVSPGPSRPHQRCVGHLLRLVAVYVEQWQFGETLMGPGQVLPDANTEMQPDVFVIPPDDDDASSAWDTKGRLLLACEVLSPSTARFDRVRKRPKYQSMGAVYWIFDMDARVVEAWLPDATQPTVYHAELRWQPDGVPEPLVIDLESFFRKVVRVG